MSNGEKATISQLPYARWREELSGLISYGRSGERGHQIINPDQYLQALQARILLEIADSLDRIALVLEGQAR